MAIINDPTCTYCEEGPETAAHFMCKCSHYVPLRQEIQGESTLQKLSQYRILQDSSINHTDSHNTLVPRLQESCWGWPMDPLSGLGLRGCTSPAPYCNGMEPWLAGRPLILGSQAELKLMQSSTATFRRHLKSSFSHHVLTTCVMHLCTTNSAVTVTDCASFQDRPNLFILSDIIPPCLPQTSPRTDQIFSYSLISFHHVFLGRLPGRTKSFRTL